MLRLLGYLCMWAQGTLLLIKEWLLYLMPVVPALLQTTRALTRDWLFDLHEVMV